MIITVLNKYIIYNKSIINQTNNQTNNQMNNQMNYQMNKTHFDLVSDFHDAYGVQQKQEPFVDCYDLDPKLIPFRISLMTEELDETLEEFTKGNVTLLADGLCDLSYVTNGAGQCLGINLNESLKKYNVDINTYINENNVDPNVLVVKRGEVLCGLDKLKYNLLNFCQAADLRDFSDMEKYLVYMLRDIYDFGHSLNFHMDKMYREVHRTNMAKMCDSLEDAEKSVEAYKLEGRYKDPCVRQKGKYYVVFDNDTSKIIKKYGWTEPDLNQFL